MVEGVCKAYEIAQSVLASRMNSRRSENMCFIRWRKRGIRGPLRDTEAGGASVLAC